VAEDNQFNAQLLEQLLTRRGHYVRLANNGREALAATGEAAFDLLLLDVHMPELDGFSVIRAIREREQAAGGHLPVIALTARSRKEDRDRCLAAGMDDFLAKPIRAADLWAAIDGIVAAHPREDRGQTTEDRRQRTDDRGQTTEDRRQKPRTLHRPLSSVVCPLSSGPGLLNPQVLLAACGGDGAILERICHALQAGLPDQLIAVRAALRDQDAPRLREAAHKLCGTVAAFSTAAGAVASDLEDVAALGRLDEAAPLMVRLETMAQGLMERVSGLSLETLLCQAEGVDGQDRTAGPGLIDSTPPTATHSAH
jgi:CheY-like chemotaxis protein